MKKTGDEYFDSEEFRNLLADYESKVAGGQPVFLDADELAEIADYYQLTGKADEADAAISLALSLSPGAVAPLTYKIHEALYNGETEKAWQYLEQIIEKNEPDYVYDKGEIMLAEGRLDEADSYFFDEIKGVPATETQDYFIDVAAIFTDYGYNEKAMEWMKRAKKEDSPNYKELMARMLYGLGRYDDSEKLFNELIDNDPFSKKYWSELANTQLMREDFSAAISSSEYAIALDPEDADGLLAKANGLYRLGNNDEAIDYYERYLRQVPNDELAMLNQGTCYINIGENEKAVETLKKAIATAPSDSVYLCDLYHELAFAYSEQNKSELALECVDKAEELGYDSLEMKIIRGHILLSAGRPNDAQGYFGDAILTSDNPPKTLLRIIISLYDNHYLEAAYKLINRFFTLEGRDEADGYAYKALICYDLRRYDEFLDNLKIACEVNPKECMMALKQMFPDDLEPKDYYNYIKNKMKKQ